MISIITNTCVLIQQLQKPSEHGGEGHDTIHQPGVAAVVTALVHLPLHLSPPPAAPRPHGEVQRVQTEGQEPKHLTSQEVTRIITHSGN